MRPTPLLACALAAALAACTRTPAPADPAPVQPPAPAPGAPLPEAAPAPPAAPGAPVAQVSLALSGEGLDFVSERGSVRHLLFGAPAAQAIEAVSRTRGGAAPQRGRNGECGAGPIDMATWPDGLTVMGQDGRFVGWSLARGAAAGASAGPATMAGIGVGSTRRELEAAYAAEVRATTLGQEFAAGDLFGLLDGAGPDARIDAMWAGTSCNFR